MIMTLLWEEEDLQYLKPGRYKFEETTRFDICLDNVLFCVSSSHETIKIFQY